MTTTMIYLANECGGDEVRVWKHGAVGCYRHVQLTGVRDEGHRHSGGVERRKPEHDVAHLPTSHGDGALRPGQVTDQ